MEELIYYVWRHKIFPLCGLKTTDGKEVEVIDPGLQNWGSGPDFFNAKVKIGGQLWVGNVEMHVRSSDWFRHHHDTDQAYNNVVLHVVGEADMEVPYPNGSERMIPQVVLPVPENVQENYDHLVRTDTFPRCFKEVPSFSPLTVHSWMSALQVERLDERSEAVKARWELLGRNWEETFFVSVARNFGFGKNGDAFEAWAKSFPLISLGKHRDSLFQIEAVFFGQAGLLSEAHPEFGEYYTKLRSEYHFLSHKFGLKPISASQWTHKVRPENFPEVRLAQLASLYYGGKLNMSALLNAKDLSSMRALFKDGVSDYWRTHYMFKEELSPEREKQLSDPSADLIIMNTVVPFLFTYGRYKGDDELCNRSFDLMEQMHPEKNRYIRLWKEAGIICQSAADSQALMQLSKNYCEKHNCLRCRFGYEYIRRHPDFLKEKENN